MADLPTCVLCFAVKPSGQDYCNPCLAENAASEVRASKAKQAAEQLAEVIAEEMSKQPKTFVAYGSGDAPPPTAFPVEAVVFAPMLAQPPPTLWVIFGDDNPFSKSNPYTNTVGERVRYQKMDGATIEPRGLTDGPIPIAPGEPAPSEIALTTPEGVRYRYLLVPPNTDWEDE